MRETRLSGSEGGVKFNPSSPPLSTPLRQQRVTGGALLAIAANMRKAQFRNHFRVFRVFRGSPSLFSVSVSPDSPARSTPSFAPHESRFTSHASPFPCPTDGRQFVGAGPAKAVTDKPRAASRRPSIPR